MHDELGVFVSKYTCPICKKKVPSFVIFQAKLVGIYYVDFPTSFKIYQRLFYYRMHWLQNIHLLNNHKNWHGYTVYTNYLDPQPLFTVIFSIIVVVGYLGVIIASLIRIFQGK